MSSGSTKELSISIWVNWLAIRPKIFVAKTFRDLKIFLDATHHEQLFVLLRRLGKRIEFSRAQSAWNQKISRAFRGALGQNRSLNFVETFRIEIIARCFCDLMTKAQISRKRRPTQIEITIRQAEIFVVDRGVEWEREIVGAVQHHEL